MNRDQSYIFKEHIWPLRDKMFRLAHRITLSQEEAEDVVQDTMERLWRERDNFSLINSIEAWTLRLVRNLSIDRLKRSGRNTVALDAERDAAPVAGTDQQVEMEEKMRIVREAMDRLPEIQRSIMQLRDIEGKTYTEIAEILQISESQVKVYLHRGREKVKKSLIGV
ncbi:MAG: RNA polymerase sigma factor [Bacteroidaceae bacterium]|jgi:RNA polymerase sigma-70 factor (ECF subfamily)|nr:RNA polymerase sigma factor [Bacteroidaceae bacterium]